MKTFWNHNKNDIFPGEHLCAVQFGIGKNGVLHVLQILYNNDAQEVIDKLAEQR